MMATVKSYDPRCYELAETFLADEPALNYPEYIHSLAIEIQELIEDEISFMLAEQTKGEVKS